MNTTIEKPITDFLFDEYQSKQHFAISPENIHKQSHALHHSDKFIFDGKNWIIKPYHGFAVVSMVNNNPGNEILLQNLSEIKDHLNNQLNKQETYYMLPEHSFHQTIANTLSDKRFYENIVNKGLLDGFPDMVEGAFNKILFDFRSIPIKMEMIGINVFGSCLALLGVFAKEQDYFTIQSFRKQFYDDSEIQMTDTRWTRPFVGHITLAYLGREINCEERTLLAATINELNTSFDFSNAVFNITQTELRSYTDLSCFNKITNYPIFRNCLKIIFAFY